MRLLPYRYNMDAGGWLLSFRKCHEPFRAAWVGEAGWLSLEGDFSKGSFLNPAVVLPWCGEVVFQTSLACRVFSRWGVWVKPAPIQTGLAQNPRTLGPSSWVLSCRRESLGRFALFQGMLVVGRDGFGLTSSAGALLPAGEKQPDPYFPVSDWVP